MGAIIYQELLRYFIAAPQGCTVILKIGMRKLSAVGASNLPTVHVTGNVKAGVPIQ